MSRRFPFGSKPFKLNNVSVEGNQVNIDLEVRLASSTIAQEAIEEAAIKSALNHGVPECFYFLDDDGNTVRVEADQVAKYLKGKKNGPISD